MIGELPPALVLILGSLGVPLLREESSSAARSFISISRIFADRLIIFFNITAS